MKRTFFAFVILAFIVACGNSGTDKTADSSTSSSTAPATAAADGPDGEKVYKQYCVTCHGVYGDMAASGAFDLTTSKLTEEERIAVITNGREGTVMVSFKSILDETKIKAVAQYIVKLRK
ncbi:MAG: cytochrome c [Saprospiraceae bacterium]|nr:cytochrome c [Saprospiraceae bacterium]